MFIVKSVNATPIKKHLCSTIEVATEVQNVSKIRQLLLDCLEHHYKTLENCFVDPNKEKKILEEIRKLVS